MDLTLAARRITRTLFAAQSLASAATVAILPMVSILGARLSGHPSYAGVPAAAQTALALDLNPRTFAVMIAVAASASFITPQEPASLLVYGPGRYRFFDFLRVGLPLTIVVYGLAVLLVPRIWSL